MTTQDERLAAAAVSDANAALTDALGTDREHDARARLRLAEQRVRILAADEAMILDTSTGTVR